MEPRPDDDGDDHHSADAGRSDATTNGGQIVVDDRPFFPTAVWAQCSDGFDSNINDGINLFMGDGCGKDDTDLAHGSTAARTRSSNAENAGMPTGAV